jgi:hypothetical protein
VGTDQNRVRPGVPAGGQFATNPHPEASGLDLSDLDLVDLPDDPQSTNRDSRIVPQPNPPAPVDQFPGLAPGVADRLDPEVFRDARQAVALMVSRPGDPVAAAKAELAVGRVGLMVDMAARLQEVRNQADLELPDPLDPDFVANRVAESGQAVREVLGAIRPLGLPAGETLVTVDSHRPAERAFNAAAAQFPADWLAASQSLAMPLRARVSAGRNHYIEAKSYRHDEGTQLREARVWAHSPFTVPPDSATNIERTEHGVSWSEIRPVKVKSTKRAAIITVPSPGRNPAFAARVATHELTHRMEDANHQLGRLEQAFLDRRCVDTDGNPNRTHSYRGIRHKERIRDGGFVDEYTGKIYPDPTYREVLSTGTEAVFNGDHGGLVGRGGAQPDPDHRAFVLGCLAVA